MISARAVKMHLSSRGIAEIPICDMDRERFVLVDFGGRRYHELKTNLWTEADDDGQDIVYLGTGRHSGGIVLKPLFVKISGRWFNVTTGQEAPVDQP